MTMTALVRAAALLVSLLSILPCARADALTDHPGRWLGKLTLPSGQVLPIGAEFFTRADGAPWAKIASPDQFVYDVPVKAITHEADDALVLDAGAARMQLRWKVDHFEGEWRQGPTPLPLQLRQVADFPMRVRPQTPQPPFPYREETLAIRSTGGVVLGATLTVPRAPAHPNVVVLVAGSGPQSRHVNNAGHAMFDVLADALARQGLAVLRYDKRGIASSTGDYDGHTLVDLQDDAYAVLQALASRKQFARIGLVGHSEGSQIAAAVAARHPQSVDFLVSLGGVGMSGFDLLLQQDSQWARDHGATPEDLARVMPYVRTYYETVLATADGQPRVAALKAVHAALAPRDQDLIRKLEMNGGTLSPDMAAQAFLPVSLRTDTTRDWSMVRCPVLVLSGSLDHQVPPRDNVDGIVAALKAGGNGKVAASVLPSLNHLFQTARSGAEDEYAQIDETMAPLAMKKIADFARAR